MTKTTTATPISLDLLKEQGNAPDWLTDHGLKTLQAGYLLPDETPKGMWQRISSAAAERLQKPEMTERFFDLFWKNWLCPATPVATNMGTKRGLPISCFSAYIPDSVDGIMTSMHEIAMLSKHGGGIGSYYGALRPRGSKIKGNGKTDGIVPFLKILDSTISGISQGGVRRGAAAAYLPIEHGDYDEFVNIRKPHGDVNRQCLNLHHGVTVGDEFMEKVIKGDKKSREKWRELLKTRMETGEPYIMFRDSVNRHRPECYKQNGLEVSTSQLCSEIVLFNDELHTFVCCLSSMNLARWDEWKDTDAIQVATWFLDGVMTEFIDRAKQIPGFENAVRFSEKSRALGLGVLGWHSLLQSKMFSMDSFDAYMLNNVIFKKLREEAEKATADLAAEYGEPEWCKGFNRRNTHLLACAPTASNSIISGDQSAGIEPYAANAFSHKTAKGTFLQKNRFLEKLLEDKEMNTIEVWRSIITNEGSVQQLDFLSEEEKAVFLTAREMNMFTLIKLAGARQKWLDQTQSLNLFFPANASADYLNKVHLEAWKSGVQTLYYCRASSVLKGDSGTREYKRESSECTMCEG